MGARGRLTALLFVASVAAAPARASAQHLSIQGDRFAVDGAPRFLTFISYFDAMRAMDVAGDLQFLHESGFDGVRIWPTRGLIRSDGTLDPNGLARLTFVLDRARDERLVVDITFTAEHIDGLTAANDRAAIGRVARALTPYDNILFDIQNERNVYGPFGRPLAPGDVAAIAATIKQIDPTRIVTASNSPDPNLSAEDAARFTVDTGLDVTAYHDPRTPNWYERSHVQAIVDAMRANTRPAYLQEPTRFPFASTDRADYFRAARANAKRAGAAAWCFHTEFGFDLRSARLRDLLQSRQEPEWDFVTSLVTRVHLRTSDGAHFVVAEGGGGSTVHADRRSAGEWETFMLLARDGGPALGGDRVTLQTSDGRHYLQATSGGGGTMTAAGEIQGSWETFVIDNGRDDPIAPDDVIRLRTATEPPWYVTAEQGGGGDVNVNRSSPGAWESFTLLAAQGRQ